MLNFTMGPVQTNETVRKIGFEQVPYFRTPEFSRLMLDNEDLMKHLTKADDNARAVFITGSGTASMEAVVANVFTKEDKLLVVNGGSFGQRFADLCGIYEIPYTEIKLEPGKTLKKETLDLYNKQGYTGLLVNALETSTGVYYDLNMISDFCKNNNILLAVDAISSFLADHFDMKKLNAAVMITGSQKALACPPGVSIIVLSSEAIERIQANNVKSMYFDLKEALLNMERGQTPFTPAVSILIQINARLNQIEENGGLEKELDRIAALANDFRKKVSGLPFEVASDSLSNAVTPLHPLNVSAYSIFTELKDRYGIWICPNGGNFTDKIFRVGHIGDLTIEDNDTLINALNDMLKRKML